MGSISRPSVVSLITLVVMFVAARAEAGPIYFNAANGHYYTLSTGIQNWVQAEAEAVSLGGHLVSITSATEQSFIETTFLTGANDKSLYWIGANDIASEGTWTWTTGEAFAYTNWNNPTGEPNDCVCVVGGEDYGSINWHYWQGDPVPKGTWNDTSLTAIEYGPQPYGITQGIIEFDTDPTAVPEPGTLLLFGAGLLGTASRLRRARRRA